MPCEKYSGWMTDAVLGELGAEREPELLAHAMECTTCREALAHTCAVHEFIDRGVAALVAGEPSPQFAAHLRRRIAQESGPLRSPWVVCAPIVAGALALAVVLAIMVARRPEHNRSNPNVAAVVSLISAPCETIASSATIPHNAGPTASKPNSEHVAEARKAAAARPEIIVPQDQLSAAAQLSAAIVTGRVDGNQLLAAQQVYDKPLEVKPVAIAPVEIPALHDTEEKPANSIQF